MTKYLDAYDTVRAPRAIQEYVDALSTWYLRRSRKRRDVAFFLTLAESMATVAKVIAPFMPYLADELYLKLKARQPGVLKAASVHLTDWPHRGTGKMSAREKGLLAEMAEIRRLASLGLAERAKAAIKVRQPLSKLTIGGGSSEGRVKVKQRLLSVLLRDNRQRRLWPQDHNPL